MLNLCMERPFAGIKMYLPLCMDIAPAWPVQQVKYIPKGGARDKAAAHTIRINTTKKKEGG